MTSPTPTPTMATFRRLAKKARGAPYMAELLSDNGQAYAKDFPGYVYVREILSADATTGGINKGETYLVMGHRSFPLSYGVRVWVVYVDYLDEWVVAEGDPASYAQQGYNPGAWNALNPYTQLQTLDAVGPLRSFAVSSGNTATTEVFVDNQIYLDYRGVMQNYIMSGSNRPDLADYAPAAGLKRLVHLWRNHDNTISVSQSTPKSQALKYQIDLDLKEVLEDRPNQLADPICAWSSPAGLTSADPELRYIDTRQWLNSPKYAGFPNPVDKNYIVPAGVCETVSDKLTVTAKLTVAGKLTVQAQRTPLHWRDTEPYSFTVNTGTLVSGTIEDTHIMYDGNAIVVEEVIGEPGYNVLFNFRGVSTVEPPNFIIGRWIDNGSANHFATIDAYNYRTAAWDQIEVFTFQGGFWSSLTQYTPTGNRSDFIDNSGNAQIRFYHHTAGNPTHNIHIGYVGLTYGVRK